MLRSPEWHLLIVWYFFLGGIAGGAYFTAAIADNFGGKKDRDVIRIGYFLSVLLIALCGILLILDLGVPTRFLNMMGFFSFSNPMSIGAWMLGVFGFFAFVSAVLSLSASDSVAPFRRLWSLVGTATGFFLASYTGVLLSNSAQPFWSDARVMGALFLASGASTGMAAISLLMSLSGEAAGEGFKKVKRADRFAMIFELLVLALFLALLGSAAAPLTTGHMAPLFWVGLVIAGLVVPLVLDLAGGSLKVPAVVPAVLVLVGGFVMRYVIVMANA